MSEMLLSVGEITYNLGRNKLLDLLIVCFEAGGLFKHEHLLCFIDKRKGASLGSQDWQGKSIIAPRGSYVLRENEIELPFLVRDLHFRPASVPLHFSRKEFWASVRCQQTKPIDERRVFMLVQKNTLSYSVRIRVLGHFLGRFCILVAGLNLATLLVALLTEEHSIALSYVAIIVGLTLCGFLLSRIRISDYIQVNEALVLIVLIFLTIPTIMAIPQVLAGVPFVDALFETVSAVTTTGLSTLGRIEERPFTFQFARAWMQWYGGLGIVVFSLALIVRPGMSALHLVQLDKPDDLVGGTRVHARRVLLVYSWITIIGFALWIILGGNPRHGLLYILAAVSTGGFAPTSGSFADLGVSSLPWLVTLVSIAGAIPLALYQQSLRKNWRYFFRNIEMRMLIATGAFFSVVLVVSLLIQNHTFKEAILHGPLMAFSAQTTAGFSSLNVALLSAGDKITLMLAMSLGGNIGSTAGGVKLLRILILCGLLIRCLKKLTVPAHAVVAQRLGKRRIETQEIQDALMIILLFAGVVLFSWIPFLFYGFKPLDSLFEVVSATATAGLSSGVSQTGLPTPLKAVLCIDMLLGRLEFVAWLLFFYPQTWFSRKRELS